MNVVLVTGLILTLGAVEIEWQAVGVFIAVIAIRGKRKCTY